jgi:hypothetical protein
MLEATGIVGLAAIVAMAAMFVIGVRLFIANGGRMRGS